MDMKFDAMDAGIMPGGLRNRSNVRLLICYIISCVKAPLSKDTIITAMQEYGIANYFETVDAFTDLLNKKNIVRTEDSEELYTLTKSGKLIADNLSDELPMSVKERATEAVNNILMKQRIEKENQAEIIKAANGYMVDCHIKGTDGDLFAFQIYVPDTKQARLVKKNFQSNAEMIYKTMLATITNNADFATKTLEEIEKSPRRTKR